MLKSLGFFIAFAAALISAGAAGVRAEEPRVAGNLEVVTKLTLEIAAELRAAFPGNAAERGVYLHMEADDEKYQVMRSVITSSLADNGFKVYASEKTPAAETPESTAVEPLRPPMRLEIRALEFAIRYPRIYRSFLIGGKRVERDASVAISATLVNPEDGSVIWVKEMKRTFHDRFSFRMLSEVENDLFAFTKP
ncbi:MAG: hypothetical protein HY770_07240, partial [Chitinivibrionia bacterium]|nr:hypothetical protein [Chitinivibrionia bacterium]